jgi:membrane protein YdbS with pleckstrin-like domain
VLEPQPIDRRAVTLFRLHGAVITLVVTAVSAIAIPVVMVAEVPWWVYGYPLPVALVLIVVFVAIVPPIKWRLWKFGVSEDEIFLQHGWFVVRRVLIPMNRVQHVDTAEGPFARRLGLSSVTIATAATVHEIPALTTETATEIRDRISRLAREAREQV